MNGRRTLSTIDESSTPSSNLAVHAGEDRGADELSRRMLSWSGLWFGSSGACAINQEQYLVRERLLTWLERCIGRQASAVLSSRVEDVSLSTSTPLLTALLGRRAMVELSRRVLSDL